MVIVSQDKTMILNYENIEAIGIGNPLENDEGKFTILVDTISDNQYKIAMYDTEERTKEVLQELLKKMNSKKYLLKPKAKKVKLDQRTMEAAKKYFERINEIKLIIDDENFGIVPIGNKETIIFEIPKE